MYACTFIHVTKLQILLANQLNYMQPLSVLFLYAYPSNFKFPLDKCIIHVLLRVFFFNIKLSTVHVYQMTSCSSITEHRAINFDWVAVSPSLSRDQKLIEFFSSRQNGHLEEKFGHAHTFLNIPDKISLLIYWVTSSHYLYSLMRRGGGGRKEEGGGWLRTLSLTLFSARSFPTVHCWSLEETNQALNEWIYCSIWSV